jgi:hypothetical protein
MSISVLTTKFIFIGIGSRLHVNVRATADVQKTPATDQSLPGLVQRVNQFRLSAAFDFDQEFHVSLAF